MAAPPSSAAAAAAAAHHATLDAVYAAMQALSPSSPPASFKALAALFDQDCVVYPWSMREYMAPACGRAAAVAELQEKLKDMRMAEVRALARSSSADGSTVFCETQQRLEVRGTTVEPFYEVAVATFTAAGLIGELKFYSCRSQIVKAVQDHTGFGPYGERYAEWEASMDADGRARADGHRAAAACCE